MTPRLPDDPDKAGDEENMTEPIPVTDEMVERACASLWWNPELAGGPPCVARSRDYLLEYDRYTEEEKASGGRREHDMEAYKAAEAEAYRLNREAMRKTLEAALNGEGPADLARMYADLRQLIADYGDDERGAIALMPFAASLDQLFHEKYRFPLPDGEAGS